MAKMKLGLSPHTTNTYRTSAKGHGNKFVCNPIKTPYSSQRPPQVCAKCGNPVDGPYCRYCALLRKKLKEVWFKIYDEHNLFQDFLNTFESSNDDSNVVNAPQEPIVFNQNPREDSSQSPLQIDHQCCYGCGRLLDGVFSRRCTCESCGNGAHIGYNCPLKVPVVSNPKPCHNQNVDELPQTLTNFHPTRYSGDENSSAYDSTPNFFNDSPNVFHPPPQTLKNSYEFCGNDTHYSHDYPHETFHYQPMNYYEPNLCYESNYSGFDQFQPPQPPIIHQPPQETSAKILHDHGNVINSVQTFLRKLNRFSFFKTPKVLLLACDRISKIKNAVGNKQYKPEDVHELFRKLLNDVQNIHEELAEYINIPSWNYRAFSSHNDDDDDDENYTIAITPEEPDKYLSMGDEHLDAILATQSNEVIKSSVEDLVPILSESEGIPDNTCDVPFRDNSPPLDVSEDQFEEFFDSNDDTTSIDDKYFSIDNIDYVEASPPDSELVSLKEDKDDNLHEKFLLPHFLSPLRIATLSWRSPILLSYSDNSLPEFETFSNHTEETNSGNTTTHVDYSLLKYDLFLFETEPDQGELTSIIILAEPQVHVPNVLTTHPTRMLDSDFIPSKNSLPESEIFFFDIKEKNSGSTTILANICLPDLECFNFKREPDPGELTSIVDFGIHENVLSATNMNLPPEEDHSSLFTYVVWIVLSFLTYPMVPLNILSFGNEDTIFDSASPIIISPLLCQVYLIRVKLS
uniref:CCHC-type domain-containing protein n=1 Tax=Tanacetum cinerariifolium TaxID=118510 RepID=A0A6L2J5Y1_TANCI|nr:hypothetical protein [Tanacetum cinerariifolium]